MTLFYKNKSIFIKIFVKKYKIIIKNIKNDLSIKRK